MVEVPPGEYTIDGLAAVSEVPARTIRYYQTEGVLPPPRRQGRIALYGTEHLDRLALISRLKARGLQLGAIADLVAGSQARDRTVEEWLDLKDRFWPDWASESPSILTRDDALARVGSEADLDALLASGLMAAEGREAVRVEYPPLLEGALQLRDQGFSLDMVATAYGIALEHSDAAAREILDRFGAEKGFMRGVDPDGAVAMGSALRKITAEVAGRLLLARIDRAITAGGEDESNPGKRQGNSHDT